MGTIKYSIDNKEYEIKYEKHETIETENDVFYYVVTNGNDKYILIGSLLKYGIINKKYYIFKDSVGTVTTDKKIIDSILSSKNEKESIPIVKPIKKPEIIDKKALLAEAIYNIVLDKTKNIKSATDVSKAILEYKDIDENQIKSYDDIIKLLLSKIKGYDEKTKKAVVNEFPDNIEILLMMAKEDKKNIVFSIRQQISKVSGTLMDAVKLDSIINTNEIYDTVKHFSDNEVRSVVFFFLDNEKIYKKIGTKEEFVNIYISKLLDKEEDQENIKFLKDLILSDEKSIICIGREEAGDLGKLYSNSAPFDKCKKVTKEIEKYYISKGIDPKMMIENPTEKQEIITRKIREMQEVLKEAPKDLGINPAYPDDLKTKKRNIEGEFIKTVGNVIEFILRKNNTGQKIDLKKISYDSFEVALVSLKYVIESYKVLVVISKYNNIVFNKDNILLRKSDKLKKLLELENFDETEVKTEIERISKFEKELKKQNVDNKRNLALISPVAVDAYDEKHVIDKNYFDSLFSNDIFKDQYPKYIDRHTNINDESKKAIMKLDEEYKKCTDEIKNNKYVKDYTGLLSEYNTWLIDDATKMRNTFQIERLKNICKRIQDNSEIIADLSSLDIDVESINADDIKTIEKNINDIINIQKKTYKIERDIKDPKAVLSIIKNIKNAQKETTEKYAKSAEIEKGLIKRIEAFKYKNEKYDTQLKEDVTVNMIEAEEKIKAREKFIEDKKQELYKSLDELKISEEKKLIVKDMIDKYDFDNAEKKMEEHKKWNFWGRIAFWILIVVGVIFVVLQMLLMIGIWFGIGFLYGKAWERRQKSYKTSRVILYSFSGPFIMFRFWINRFGFLPK